MPTGAITGYIDVAQLTLYAFWIFFAGLIFYLRREDKREGYPLISDSPARVTVQGLPALPSPKVFRMPNGGLRTVPRTESEPPLPAAPLEAWFGAPLEPTGNPMVDGVGAASYAMRAETPEQTFEGEPRIVPLRVATNFFLERSEADPRGMTVIGGDRQVAGVVRDLWIDRTEPQVRYLEVEVAEVEVAGAPEPLHVLLPTVYAAQISAPRREIRVNAILASQFAAVPRLQNPDQVTLREEDRITAYYAGGYLYATPSRREPLL